jgi:hypothetical protein
VIGNTSRTHQDILETITALMQEYNPFYQIWLSSRERLIDNPTTTLALSIASVCKQDPRRYNCPTASDILQPSSSDLTEKNSIETSFKIVTLEITSVSHNYIHRIYQCVIPLSSSMANKDCIYQILSQIAGGMRMTTVSLNAKVTTATTMVFKGSETRRFKARLVNSISCLPSPGSRHILSASLRRPSITRILCRCLGLCRSQSGLLGTKEPKSAPNRFVSRSPRHNRYWSRRKHTTTRPLKNSNFIIHRRTSAYEVSRKTPI